MNRDKYCSVTSSSILPGDKVTFRRRSRRLYRGTVSHSETRMCETTFGDEPLAKKLRSDEAPDGVPLTFEVLAGDRGGDTS